MFYQNSNDLVKRASMESQHSQNSYQTSNHLIKNLHGQFGTEFGDKANILPSSNYTSSSNNYSSIDSISNKFNDVVKDIFKFVRSSIIEGNDPIDGVSASIDSTGGASEYTGPATTAGSATTAGPSGASVSPSLGSATSASTEPASASISDESTSSTQPETQKAIKLQPPQGVSAISDIPNGATITFKESEGASSYKVTAVPNGGEFIGPYSPITANGLKAGVSYTFTVTATNDKTPDATSMPSTPSASTIIKSQDDIYQDSQKANIDNQNRNYNMQDQNSASMRQNEQIGANPDAIRIQNNEYMIQQRENNRRIKTINDIIATDDKRTRNNWVEVVDKDGISKYGYITNNNIFQVWYIPGNPANNPVNWFTNEPIKRNDGVLGCPKFPATINTIQISNSWDNIKPYDGVYSRYDDKVPVFFLTESGVRDVNRSYKKSGLFSCGSETKNIAVKERPSADFDFEQNNDNPYKQGCFVVKSGKSITGDLAKSGFKFQDDLGKTSISKCKRRTEDLGRSFFFMAENSDAIKNKADCYVYATNGVPNIETIVSLDEKGASCYNVNSKEAEEDGYMKAYESTILPRMYGTKQTTTTKTPAKCPPGYNKPTADVNNKNYCYTTLKKDCNEACAKKNCVSNGGKWIPTDSRYNPYTCQMAEPKVEKQNSQSISLYSLKTTGPTGVDTLEPEKPGLIGKIAFITHNGEKREYPRELLKTDTGMSMNLNDVAFMEVGNYDTRSKTDNYGVNGSGDNGIDGITFEECKKRCVENKNSGGFVFTGSKNGGVGKCQLKHKDKMFPIGLRQSDPTKTLVLKMPAIQESVSNDCRMAGQIQRDGTTKKTYVGVDSLQYAYYLDGGFMKNDTKCDVTKYVPQVNKVKPVDANQLARQYNKQTVDTKQQIAGALTAPPSSGNDGAMTQGFTIREGIINNADVTGTADFSGSSYDTTMSGVSSNIMKIGNATRQQETINAFKNESNIRLIAESYKFILWTILAILAVMAILKLKEKFSDGSEEDSIMGAISSLGAGVSMDDIGDKTESVKNSLSESVDQIQEGARDAAGGITEGANNAVSGIENGITNISSGISNAGNRMSQITDNVSNMLPSSSGSSSGSGMPSRGGRLRRK